VGNHLSSVGLTLASGLLVTYAGGQMAVRDSVFLANVQTKGIGTALINSVGRPRLTRRSRGRGRVKEGFGPNKRAACLCLPRARRT
jgi:hypothetical protein